MLRQAWWSIPFSARWRRRTLTATPDITSSSSGSDGCSRKERELSTFLASVNNGTVDIEPVHPAATGSDYVVRCPASVQQFEGLVDLSQEVEAAVFRLRRWIKPGGSGKIRYENIPFLVCV